MAPELATGAVYLGSLLQGAMVVFLALGLLIVILDQGIKYWAQTQLPFGVPVPVIPPVVYFTYIRNTGAAFSLLENHTWFLILIGFLAGFLVWYYRHFISKQSAMFHWGLTLSLAGAVGNQIDRLRFGSVIDFVDFRYFPVFNLADSCIVVGVGLIIWSLLRSPE